MVFETLDTLFTARVDVSAKIKEAVEYINNTFPEEKRAEILINLDGDHTEVMLANLDKTFTKMAVAILTNLRETVKDTEI